MLFRYVSVINLLCFSDTAKLFGATEFVNPKDLKGTVEDAIIAMTDGGCDYTFECIGNINTMVRSY